MKTILFTFLFVLVPLVGSTQSPVHWLNFDKELFQEAKKQQKMVVLDLRANWCHWCHVMEDSTYASKPVAAYLNQYYLVAEADQDKRPDLANRYRDYGWPATIIFDAKGTEIVKRSGYISPSDFLDLLKAVVKDPSPEEAIVNEIKKEEKDTSSFAKKGYPFLFEKFENSLDKELGGFGFAQKYLDFDTYDYAFQHSLKDTALESWVKISVRNAQSLSDKEWGGVFQYSTHYDWDHAHFEKLLSVQARYMRIYAWYYARYREKWALDAAEKIAGYCQTFLASNKGGFFNAQDADVMKGRKATEYYSLSDIERRKIGVPAIDTHVFVNVNAQMIEALVGMWAITGKQSYLEKATQTMDYLLKSCLRVNGGFMHSQEEKEGLMYLSDNLYAAKALLTLYRATGEKRYEENAKRSVQFIHDHFAGRNGGYLSYEGDNGLLPSAIVSENIDLCRFYNLFSYAINEPNYKKEGQSIFAYLSSPLLMKEYSTEPGILSAYEELSQEPLTATFLMYKKTEETMAMLQETVAFPTLYFVNHTYFKKTELPEDKADLFSSFDSSVLFFCTSTYCSQPVFTVKGAKDILYKRK